MKVLFERALQSFFPPENNIIKTDEDRDHMMLYAVSNYSEIDPFRPFGHWDSWAGCLQENNDHNP